MRPGPVRTSLPGNRHATRIRALLAGSPHDRHLSHVPVVPLTGTNPTRSTPASTHQGGMKTMNARSPRDHGWMMTAGPYLDVRKVCRRGLALQPPKKLGRLLAGSNRFSAVYTDEEM